MQFGRPPVDEAASFVARPHEAGSFVYGPRALRRRAIQCPRAPQHQPEQHAQADLQRHPVQVAIDQIADFRTAVRDTAKSVNISGEPVLVHAERDRKSLLDLLFGDVSPWLPTREKLMDQQTQFYYLWR